MFNTLRGGGVVGRDEDIDYPTQNKNELSKTAEGDGRGSGSEGDNKNFTSPNLTSEQSFSLTPNEIKKDEPGLIPNELATKNNDRLIIGHLNINFIENKFEALASLVKDKLDIIMVSETKIDKSFPESQFIIVGYSKPFRRDRNSHGGGLLIYIRDDIPCKEIRTQKLPDDIEGIFIVINLRNNKCIIMGVQPSKIKYLLFFNPNKQRIG